MYHLELPALQMTEVFPNCARRTSDRQMRAAFLAEEGRVQQRSKTYSLMAAAAALHEMARQDSVHVSGIELADLYERALVKGLERPTYLALRGASRFGRCPFCSQRDVRTLDHYLPKGAFPEFAVLPMNLVPCCFDCNHAKLDHTPVAFSDQVFHPYFDDWDDVQVIRAEVEIEDRVFVEFSVNYHDLPPEVADRAQKHFTIFNLAALYSDNASIELVQKKISFRLTFESGGRDALRTELLRESQSRRVPFPNAWQPALYGALAESAEFIDGGFQRIEE
jgi:hypothetical protein